MNTRASAITLDTKHTEFLNKFAHEKKHVLPLLQKKKTELIKRLKEMDTINVTDIDIYHKKIKITEELEQVKLQILQIKKNKKNYLKKNVKHIFDYFEEKKNISTTSNDTIDTKGIKSNFENNKIHSFFKIQQPPIPPQIPSVPPNALTMLNKNIVNKYLNNIGEYCYNINSYIYSTDICQSCFKGELKALEDEGILICTHCSRSITYLIENEKPSYKEPPKEVCYYAYKRANHFKEILMQFQAKEMTHISEEQIEKIQAQIKKERITLDQLDYYKMKSILKKLGYNKLYEHIAFIKNRLGIKPPIISPQLEDVLFNLFNETLRPYAKFCPPDRQNYLHYYYTLYKLCELLDERQYLPLIPMLIDDNNRTEQDIVWAQICEELHWQFIPTL